MHNLQEADTFCFQTADKTRDPSITFQQTPGNPPKLHDTHNIQHAKS